MVQQTQAPVLADSRKFDGFSEIGAHTPLEVA